MMISTQTRYGVRFLLELALHESIPTNDGQKLTTSQIAKKQGLSEKYLGSIASKLKKGGLLISSKGMSGGYMLAKPPEEISIGDVMRLMETSYFVIHCREDYNENCPNFDTCVLAKFWHTLEDSISHVVDDLSIENVKDLVSSDLSYSF